MQSYLFTEAKTFKLWGDVSFEYMSDRDFSTQPNDSCVHITVQTIYKINGSEILLGEKLLKNVLIKDLAIPYEMQVRYVPVHIENGTLIGENMYHIK